MRAPTSIRSALMTYEMLTGKLPFQGRTQQETDDRASAQRSDAAAQDAPRSRVSGGGGARASTRRCSGIRTTAIRRRSSSPTRSRAAAGGDDDRDGEADRSASSSVGEHDSIRVATLIVRHRCGSARSQRRGSAQQVRPYRPAFDVTDYAIAIDLPDTGATIHARRDAVSVAHAAVATRSCSICSTSTVNGVTVDGRAVTIRRAARRRSRFRCRRRSGTTPSVSASASTTAARSPTD